MSRPSGWELLTDQICDRVRDEVESQADEARRSAGTESLLMHAILTAATFGQTQHSHTLEVADASALLSTSDKFTLFYQRKPPFEGSPSRLVFYCWNHNPRNGERGWHCLLVECAPEAWIDTSDKRDVSAVCFGEQEVWADPLGCALRVFDWAAGCWP